MTADGPASTTITVDGELSAKTAETLENCCAEALLKGKLVRLHLRDVSSIDERGRGTLRLLAAKGVDLTANGVYSSYIVDGIQSGSAGRR
jgi:hypothetical protein